MLDYDPVTGVFTWKVMLSPKALVGTTAGSEYDTGYIIISIDGVKYGAHNLAWLYVYGELAMTDHKNDIKNDNRIDNLQKATYSQNNHKKYSYNPLGVKGVRFRSGLYEANIRIDGRITCLGKFNTAEEAGKAYQEAAQLHYGEFACG